jgi:hypothetical protein
MKQQLLMVGIICAVTSLLLLLRHLILTKEIRQKEGHRVYWMRFRNDGERPEKVSYDRWPCEIEVAVETFDQWMRFRDGDERSEKDSSDQWPSEIEVAVESFDHVKEISI